MKAIITVTCTIALGAIFVGAAQAHTFLWTGATPRLVLVVGEGAQVFRTSPNGVPVTCRTLKLDGTVTSESQLTQALTGSYTGCETFGFTAIVSPVEYEFNAEGQVIVGSTPIVVTVPVDNCSVKFAPLRVYETIRYLNNGGTLLAHAEVTLIRSTASGPPCGPAGVQLLEGTYFGLALISVDAAGSLSWT